MHIQALRLWLAGLLAAGLINPAGAETDQLNVTRQLLGRLEQAETVYDRLDLVEAGLDQIAPLLKAQPKWPEALLLRGRLYLALAEARAELGASALDYWEYVNREVLPVQLKARADFDRLIALASPLKAEGYFLRAATYAEDEDGAARDRQDACRLGYRPACP